jgi:hypothetical protein
MDFDPSKMDPKLMMEMSRLVQQLPPEQLSRIQTLMHNMMAGFDVRAEMETFERTLPPEFREKLVSLFGNQGFGLPPMPQPAARSEIQAESPKVVPKNIPTSIDEARLTILQGVAGGHVSPEQALQMLFPG